MLQLWHVGRVSHPSLQPGGALPVAPSAIGFAGHAHTYEGPQPFVVPRALETHEIPGIIADYAQAARNAKTAGFDGVEIHAANAYLLDQFLRDGTNYRQDAYGGSLENRARLTLEVTDAITAIWGADRVGIRLSPSLTINGMRDSDPAATFDYITSEVSRRKLAYLHVVEPKDPRGDPMDRLVDPMILRRAFAGPYIGNSGYDAERALDALAADRLDAISFGRLFIANPDLPRRLREGLPMNALNAARLYGGGADGYTDYPAFSQVPSKQIQP